MSAKLATRQHHGDRDHCERAAGELAVAGGNLSETFEAVDRLFDDESLAVAWSVIVVALQFIRSIGDDGLDLPLPEPGATLSPVLLATAAGHMRSVERDG